MDNYRKAIWKRHKGALLLGLIIIAIIFILQLLGVIEV